MKTDLEKTCEIIREGLENRGYTSSIPLEDLLSADLTEATLMVDMWIKEGLIFKKGL